METKDEKIQKALDALKQFLEESDHSGNPMIYLVQYAMFKLFEALKETKA